MTNYEKLGAVEISGARLFEHIGQEDAAKMLANIRCIDCPCLAIGSCVKDCYFNLIDWLKQEAEE